MSDHILTQENLDAYTAGGLTADERAAVERHVAECAECAHLLERAKKLEQTLSEIFTDAKPTANLEERAIRRLRKEPRTQPRWVRYALGAAAVLALALIGGVVQAVALDGGISTNRIRMAGSVDEERKRLQSVNNLKPIGIADGDPHKEADFDITYNTDRISDVSVPGEVNGKAVTLRGATTDGVDANAKKLENTLRVKNGFLNYSPPTSYAGAGGSSTGVVDGINGSYGHAAAPKQESPLSIPEDDLLLGGDKPASPGYFKRGVNAKPDVRVPNLPPMNLAAPAPPTGGGALGLVIPAKPAAPKVEGNLLNIPEEVLQPELPPEAVGRKIIRTGDMDFETKSFDDSVKTVHALINAIKGKAFVATVNSDKLSNGKMRGAVVVRMEPKFLDKFIDDLRSELGKTGELKSQRIGSQDVTKHYTDVDSELRAARAVEERFLKIIKDGKGEIKDLVAAERELGIWRTKIEKLMGEQRYYDAQIALSTLTINLTEKEIETPAALVRNEKVQMRIEVEEVNKSLEIAVGAIDELKGRLLKSESKKHKAGQFEAILHAEIPFAQKKAFEDRLAKLGLVSENESVQKEEAQGGTGKALREVKKRDSDVVFEVTLNNIVNIQPRYSVSVDIASSTVAAHFAKLQDAIGRIARGQIRVANLNEPDKQRVTATLEFNVPKEQKEAIDKLLEAAGPVLKKTNVQAPVTEIATEQKFGYVVNLYSVATLPAKEKVALTLQVDDVALKAAEIEALAKAIGGQAHRGEFNQSPGGQMSLVVALHVPLSSSGTLVGQFMKFGKVIDRKQTPNPNASENELATSLILVSLQGGVPIVPTNEGLWPKLQSGLYVGFTVLAWSVVIILTGIAIIAPWALLIWIGVRVIAWMGKGNEIAVKPVTNEPPPAAPPA